MVPGVKGLPFPGHLLHAEASQDAEETVPDSSNPLADALRARLGELQSPVQVVKDGKERPQGLEHALPLPRLELLLHALAVVVKVGEEAEVLVLEALQLLLRRLQALLQGLGLLAHGLQVLLQGVLVVPLLHGPSLGEAPPKGRGPGLAPQSAGL